jgi:hypothetical protein
MISLGSSWAQVEINFPVGAEQAASFRYLAICFVADQLFNYLMGAIFAESF